MNASRTPRASVLAAMIGLACVSARGGAQSVTGSVMDATGAPMRGVVLALLDSGGVEIGRALSNEMGHYRVAAPQAGTYRLRTLRIGFTPTLSEPIALGLREEIRRDLTVSGVALALDTVRVVGRSVCRSRGESDA